MSAPSKVIDLADVLATLERNRQTRDAREHLAVEDCDGNHCAPPCADRYCWHRDPDDVTPVGPAQLRFWPS